MNSNNIKKMNVNLDLFKIPNVTRKQKKPKEPNNRIKVKSNSNNKTMKKKLLDYIRNKQEQKLKDPLEIKTNHSSNSENLSNFNDDFKDALTFLESNYEKNKMNLKTNLNSTIKNHNFENENINLSNDLYKNNVTTSILPTNNDPFKLNVSSPKFGCLKGGSLPTYRSWVNNTQKNYPSISNQNPNTNTIVQNNISNETFSNIQPNQSTSLQKSLFDIDTEKDKLDSTKVSSNPTLNIQNFSSDISNKIDKLKENSNNLIEKPKRKLKKKIIKRNYTIGRSKVRPKISVLVSNKTIRNRISTKKTLLQQTPIEDIKKFLIKRGFIKVGSIAPNDVLRKMYETVSLICGDAYNHNPDNLVYNYFNYNESV